MRSHWCPEKRKSRQTEGPRSQGNDSGDWGDVYEPRRGHCKLSIKRSHINWKANEARFANVLYAFIPRSSICTHGITKLPWPKSRDIYIWLFIEIDLSQQKTGNRPQIFHNRDCLKSMPHPQNRELQSRGWEWARSLPSDAKWYHVVSGSDLYFKWKEQEKGQARVL